MPSRHSPDPNRSSTTSAAIPTASPFPTIASSPSRTAKSPFRWKDYRRRSRQKVMTVASGFFRRLLLHALPDGFHRMRYYGFLANRNRAQSSPTAATCSAELHSISGLTDAGFRDMADGLSCLPSRFEIDKRHWGIMLQ